jgi:OLD-like protein
VPQAEQIAMKAIVLVEGESDRIAVERVALRRGRDLVSEEVAVLAVGGAHALERALRTINAERVAGLYDRGEEASVRGALQRARVTPDGFYACDPDLEGELVRALGPERMIQLVEERGHLAAFRTYQKQPDKRSLELEAQLHGWLHNWKVRYAEALVDALDLDHVPAPLDGVLAHVWDEP